MDRHDVRLTYLVVGLYEFVRKGDPPVMGITKLGNGVTVESLMRPRKTLPVEKSEEKITATGPTPTV